MSPIIQRLNILSARTFKQASTIAIVGNGGLNDEDNELINASECVVRFNNYASREGIKYTKDRYRCNVLFTTFDLHSEGAEPDSVVIGIPFPFSCEHIERKMTKWYWKSQPYCLNPYVNLHLMKDLGLQDMGHGGGHPCPSIGFTAVWHLYHLIRHMKNWNPVVYIAGFNWYSNKEKLEIQGRHIHQPRAWHYNHHYREEMKWMIDHLLNHPSFCFSEECLSILQAFKPHIK